MKPSPSDVERMRERFRAELREGTPFKKSLVRAMVSVAVQRAVVRIMLLDLMRHRVRQLRSNFKVGMLATGYEYGAEKFMKALEAMKDRG